MNASILPSLRPSLLHLALAAALCAPAAASATAVNFDTFDQQGATIGAGDSFAAAGFVFTQLSDAPTILFAGDSVGVRASNGTASLYAANNAAFGVGTGGGRFDLSSFELGGGELAFLDPLLAFLVEPWAASITLLGTFADNSQLTQTFSIDPTSAGLAAVNVGWSDLVSVQFSASGDYSIDNLALQAIPEPPGLVWLAIAGGLFASWPRRRAR